MKCDTRKSVNLTVTHTSEKKKGGIIISQSNAHEQLFFPFFEYSGFFFVVFFNLFREHYDGWCICFAYIGKHGFHAMEMQVKKNGILLILSYPFEIANNNSSKHLLLGIHHENIHWTQFQFLFSFTSEKKGKGKRNFQTQFANKLE